MEGSVTGEGGRSTQQPTGAAVLCAPDFIVCGSDGRDGICRVRPARSDDLATMFECFRVTLRGHVEPAFGWDEARQLAGFSLKFNGEDWAVLTVDGAFGGLAWMECRDEWALRLICVRPEFQNLGIGRRWLQHVQARAGDANRRLHLKVFKTNRAARKLYERLDFRAAGELEHMHELVFDPWHPPE